MPLDISLFREHEGGNPELIRESQRRRFASVEVVDEIIAKDAKWRHMTGAIDNLRKEKNAVNKQVATRKKAKEECDDLIAQVKKIGEDIVATEAEQKELKAEITSMIGKIGNIVEDTVPFGKDEDEFNRVERTWGTPRSPEGLLNHHDLLWRIGGYEPERGAAVAGHRGYFLRDVGVLLNQAFINYGISFLRARQTGAYTVLQPPYMMRKDIMSGVAQLEQFDEELYKVGGGEGEAGDKYLIATSEQPICAYHKDEWIDEKTLPIRYAGVSTCFRKEAGSSGKDNWGIFRVHQFEKVEQFVICEDDLEVSNKHQLEMTKIAEEFYQSLGFPYQVICICSGGLNNAAIRKFDLECWFPGYNAYRELVSCSNCTDYQSRAMEIRCGAARKQGETNKRYVHMLNSTLCATGRAICCLLETYQTPDGVRVPEVLVPFMGGMTFLPFVRDSKLPDKIDSKSTSAPKAAPAAKAAVPAAAAAVAPPAAPPATAAAAPAAKVVTPEKKAPASGTELEIEQIGGKIREMKAAKADKADIQAEVEKLLAAKAKFKEETGEEYKAPGAAPAAKAKGDAGAGPADQQQQQKKKKEDKSKPPKVPILPPSYVTPMPKTVIAAATTTAAPAAAAATVEDCFTATGVNLEALNSRLSYYTYVGGYRASAVDERARAAVAAAGTLQSQQHVARWFRSVESFTAEERAQWK